MLKFLALSATILAGAYAQLQLGAKEMFYDPASVQQVFVEPAASAQPGQRPIVFARPFPSYGYVGIHCWFEDGRRIPFSERLAASERGGFALHVRPNVDGFLTAWAVQSDNDAGVELIPKQGRYTGHRVAAGAVFVVPGEVLFTTDEPPRRLLLVFSRAQQEQVVSAWGAWNKLQAISGRTGPGGPELLRETDDTMPGQIGTYVVNQVGNPVATEIVLRSR